MEITIERDDTIALYNASARGCTTTLDSLIEKDPHILKKISLTTFSETPLHISALLGHLEFTKTVLLHNSQLAVELNSQRRCPLHLASAEGHVEIVQELLQANKDACSIPDQDGRIPLHYAAMRGRVDVVRELIFARPGSTRDMVGGKETVLHLCVEYNQLEPLKLLVDSVSDDEDFLNFKNSEGGNTILHLAVMLKQIETVKYLVSMSNVREALAIRNGMNVTALEVVDHCQKDFKSFTIRNILIDAGAERPNDQSNLPPSSSMVVGHQESAKPVQSIKKWWKKLLKHLRYQGDWINEMRGTLMVVATVITTITFQPAVNPPGGVWQTDVSHNQAMGCSKDTPCVAGYSVMAYQRQFEYFIFMICNSVSFSASLCTIFLLISGFPLRNKLCMGFLTFFMCTTLTSLAAAYLYAFIMVTPEFPTDDYFDNYKAMVIVGGCVQISLMAVIGMVILIHTIRFVNWLMKKIRNFIVYVKALVRWIIGIRSTQI